MICFRTYLLLKNETTLNDIWHSFCDWRIQSTNSKKEFTDWCKNHHDSPDSYTFVSQNGKEKIETIVLDSYLGMKYDLIQQDKTFSSYIVFEKGGKRPRISYELEISSEKGITERQAFNPPNFFNAITPYFNSDDYPKHATKVSEMELTELAEFMKGTKTLHLPLIYISRKKDGTYQMDADDLSKKLFCLAFVCKEDDQHISNELRSLTDGRNAYNGAIGAYWGENYRIFLNSNPNELRDRIFRWLAFVSLPKELSWTYLKTKSFEFNQNNSEAEIERLQKDIESNKVDSQEKLSKLQKIIEELKKQNYESRQELKSKERQIEQYIADFDSENKELQEDLKAKDKIIEDLKARLQHWETPGNTKENANYTLQIYCAEKELFPGEIEDFIKGSLYCTWTDLKNDVKHKRRNDVIKSLLEGNQNFKFEDSNSCKKYEKAKEDILKGRKKIELFEQSSTNKHEKLLYRGDPRYPLTRAVSGSDKRENKNLASEADAYFLRPPKTRTEKKQPLR